MHALWQDLRYALRSLRRTPGATAVAVSSLAVSIAVGAVASGLIAYLLFGAPKPVRDVASLVDIYTNVRDLPYQTSSYPDYVDVQARTTTFDAVVASSPVILAVNLGAGTRTLVGEIISGNYFDTLGIPVSLGRPLLRDDDRPGVPRTVVVSARLWRRDFGADPRVVGRIIRIRSQPYTIVGVAPDGFVGMTPFPAEMWIPLAWQQDAAIMGVTDFVPSPGATPLERRGERWLWLKGRLKPGRTSEQARSELTSLMKQLESAYPDSNKGRRFTAVSSRDVRVHPVADRFLAPAAVGIAATVILLVLVAAGNVAGVQLARATMRYRETAVRVAVGATRGRIVRQLVTESVVLALIAGVAAVAVAWTLLRLLPASDLALPIPITFDVPSLGAGAIWFILAVSLMAGLVCGLVPASRVSLSVQADLRGAIPSMSLRRRWTVRDGLVFLQTAAAALLLITGALLTRSLVRAQHIDVGFDGTGVTAITTGTTILGYDSGRAGRFYDEALRVVRGMPEIQTAALAWRTPLDLTFYQEPVVFPGASDATPIERTYVSRDYFDALGVRLIAGRNFNEGDTPTSPRVAIVNATMARKYWKTIDNALGKRFRLRDSNGPEYEIAGVSGDYKVRTVGEAPTSYVHLAVSQHARSEWAILVRTRPGVPLPVDRIQSALRQLDPDIVFRANSIAAKVATVLAPAWLAAVGLGVIGTLALLFAAVGLYGVVAFMVAQRRREFGVRMALGARGVDIVRLVLARGLTVAGSGMIAGILLAVGTAALLRSVLYGISPGDPLSWSVAAMIVLTVSVLAHVVPARRAVAVDPARTLTAE